MDAAARRRLLRSAAPERIPECLGDDAVGAVASPHDEELHRVGVKLGNAQGNKMARFERIGDDVLGQAAPAHAGEDELLFRGDVGHAPS